MRSVALLALLAVIAAGTAISPVAYTAPTGDSAFGIPIEMSSTSVMGSVTNGAGTPLTYTIGGDVGKNFYFRATIYACNEQGIATNFQTTLNGDDGAGSLLPYHKATFTVSSKSVSYIADTPNADDTWYTAAANVTTLVAVGADSVAKASGKTWTWTVSISGTTSLTCLFYYDFFTYGKLVPSSAVGKDGIPGAVQDAWIPCCDAVQSAYQVTMTDMPHKYLEVAASTDKGSFDHVSLTNPGSLVGLVDSTSFPGGVGTGITARTCLSNQSCEIIAAAYYVELTTSGFDYTNDQKKDFHATFTLTTKAGVATASATIALAVAALFALFH